MDSFRTVLLSLLTVLLAPPFRPASPSDRAIAALLPLDTEILSRTSVDPDLDLVAALSSRKGHGKWWGPGTQLGLFLQSRSDPGKVYRLAILPGHGDGECLARPVHASPTEFILSCAAEKGNIVVHEKFRYDLSSKSLRGSSRSNRVSIVQLAAHGTRVAFRTRDGKTLAFDPSSPSTLTTSTFAFPPPSNRFGPQNAFALERGSRKNTADEAGLYSITDRSAPKPRYYPFPQSSRPQQEEAIGPWQIHDGVLWFGKTFYYGEGYSGTGGYGYFDTAARKFVVESPPEMQKASTSALLVEPDAIWLGLVHRGEWGDSPGGLLRIDRASKQIEKIGLPDIPHAFLRSGPRLLIATDLGLDIIEKKQLSRFFLDGDRLLEAFPN